MLGMAKPTILTTDNGLPSGVQGACDSHFLNVIRAFAGLYPGKMFGGGGLSVFIDGKPVVDVWTGYSDRKGKVPWTEDTGAMVFSATKGLAATIIHMLVVVTWLTVFITGAGLYFGARFARTTSAVVAVFALVLGLWAVGPMVAGLLTLLDGRIHPLTNYLWFHPTVQTELVMAGASGVQNAKMPLSDLRYAGERAMFGIAHDPFGVGRMTANLLGTASVYIVVGLVFFRQARRRLRRGVF